MKNRIISAIICSFMLLSLFAPVYAVSDFDGHWAYDSIVYMIEKNIVSGNENGEMKPDNMITRAEFIKTVNRAFEYTEKAESNFSDVSRNSWYYDELLIAKKAGYIAGDENNSANPEAALKRSEVCVILSRILKLSENNGTLSFSDADNIPSWAKGSISALVSKGYISGYPDGTFRAGNTLKRAEAFHLLKCIRLLLIRKTV